jgi:hypothetical protein
MRTMALISIWCSTTMLALAPGTARAQLTEPTAEVQPEPEAEPEQAPDPEPRTSSPARRKAGIGLMATGGVLAASGLGVTIAFTVLGDRQQNAADPQLDEIERMNSNAQIGGILLASGIAIVAIGGAVFATRNKKLERRAVARLRVAPTLGGLVVSGQF